MRLEHELDREHYLQKQVRPVAAPILASLGLDFDRTVGGRSSNGDVLTASLPPGD